MCSEIFAGVTAETVTQPTRIQLHSFVFLSFENMLADIFMCVACVVTVWASKRFSIDVNAHVAFQVRLAHGFVGAVVTYEVAGLVVSFDVPPESSFCGGPEPTHVTQVLLLSSVCEHV